MNNLRGNFAYNVRRLRKERQLSLKGFAKVMDVSSPFICKVERGATNPTLEQVMEFATGLKCDPIDLLKGNAKE